MMKILTTTIFDIADKLGERRMKIFSYSLYMLLALVSLIPLVFGISDNIGLGIIILIDIVILAFASGFEYGWMYLVGKRIYEDWERKNEKIS